MRCPYCGKNVDPGKCHIVEIAYDNTLNPNLGHGNLGHGKASVYRIVRVIKKGGGLFGRQAGPNEDLMQRYQCPHCHNPLPRGFAEKPCFVIALVGLNRVGKSSLITWALQDIICNNVLWRFASSPITDVAGAEDTARILESDYIMSIRTTGKIDANNPEDPITAPLLLDVQAANGTQYIAVIHDVGGELFVDGGRRATTLPFILWADAVIFLFDPTAIYPHPPILNRNEAWKFSGGNIHRAIPQSDLLNKIMATTFLGPNSCGRHLAVVVTKGDLLDQAQGVPCQEVLLRDTDYSNPQDLVLAREATIGLLGALGQERIVQLAQKAPSCSFHTISTMRSKPDNPDRMEFCPRRVYDPWMATLMALAGYSSQGDSSRDNSSRGEQP
jgi:hypothetical protein